jgi:hypothetical protein
MNTNVKAAEPNMTFYIDQLIMKKKFHAQVVIPLKIKNYSLPSVPQWAAQAVIPLARMETAEFLRREAAQPECVD